MSLQFKTLDYALDIKEVSDAGIVAGWASTFGNVDLVGDRVMPGAFSKSIAKAAEEGRKISCLFNHNPDWPVGYWRDLGEKAKGLFAEAQLLPDAIDRAKEVYALAKVKAVALSIGYRIPPGGAEVDEKRGITNLHEIDLREISFVTMPANIQAKVTQVKTFTNDNRPTQKQLEEFLGVHFCSKTLATAIAARALPVLRGDPEEKADPQAEFLRILHETLG